VRDRPLAGSGPEKGLGDGHVSRWRNLGADQDRVPLRDSLDPAGAVREDDTFHVPRGHISHQTTPEWGGERKREIETLEHAGAWWLKKNERVRPNPGAVSEVDRTGKEGIVRRAQVARAAKERLGQRPRTAG